MQVGIAWGGGVHHDAVKLLRPQWEKTSHQPDEQARNYALGDMLEQRYRGDFPEQNVVVDLRTGSVQEFLSHPARGAGVYDWFVDWVGEVVSASKHMVKHWEIWGEAACPYTGEGFTETDGRKLYEGMTYAELLSLVYPRIKEADPDAVVLCGGHGADTRMPYSMHLRFYQRICDAGAGEFFDVNNLHPFVLRGRDWPTIEDMLQRGFAEIKRIEWRNGLDPKPIVATEFAWPTHQGPPKEYASAVVPQVISVSEQEAADWTDRTFALFEAHGMQFVIWCGYQEAGGRFWGKHLGLLRADGTPKGALYETVLRWQEKGRQSTVAL